MNACSNPTCNQQTANKRFCSRPCAASVTNAEKSRRQRTRERRKCDYCEKVMVARFPGANIERVCKVCRSARVTVDMHKRKGKPRLALLVKANLKTLACEECGITEWRDKPAPLELDHVNGDTADNRLENLRVLCCNCHAQTPTWRRRKSSLAFSYGREPDS